LLAGLRGAYGFAEAVGSAQPVQELLDRERDRVLQRMSAYEQCCRLQLEPGVVGDPVTRRSAAFGVGLGSASMSARFLGHISTPG
jgi:hypothetical protein